MGIVPTYSGRGYSREQIALPPELLERYLEEMEQKAAESRMFNVAQCLATGLKRLRKEDDA
jgi:hypothetical protein